MRRIRLAAAVVTGLALAAGAAPPVAADSRGGPPTTGKTAGTSGGSGPGRSATVRLITGDRVTVTTDADGRHTASVTPGEGRRHVLFRTVEEDGRLMVLPSDANALLATRRLDRGLFDVTSLLAQGYDEAHSDTLPLIVGGAQSAQSAQGARDEGGAALRRLTALAADGTPTRHLETIGAEALRVPADDLGAFWKRLTPDPGKVSAAANAPRVWLDGRVHASLDRSTAQIGAPEAWKAGYEGDDVKVAVLDTGVDAGHPDLAGRITEAKNFSTGTGAGTGDGNGHGTHVASTVGGSGAASHGSRKGVAPGADLLIGKVLGDDGSGSESQVIDGMEWAVGRGADIVNLSLGSDAPSDGTDPMSQTLNELSKSSGALFVVASGNSGPGTGTIGSPAAADAALTVGAVDRDDTLADFSGRGPRPGDDAVKPDVTAPGVGIVAARAAGTTLGTVVDDHYVAASGTSMATPHVAGAAALLAQQHPDWTAPRLKDALISTARTMPGQRVTEQGGGRIDLATAVRTPVVATGTQALGVYESEDTGTHTRTVRYANHSGEDVTLDLDLRLATAGGREADPAAVRPATKRLTVPAGGTAEVPLTVAPSRTALGRYYGRLTATSADGRTVVHTTLSLRVRGPVHKLRVVFRDIEGRPVHNFPVIQGAEGYVPYTDWENGVAEVEEGTYQVFGLITDQRGSEDGLYHVVLPQVEVTEDATVVLDARRTTKVEIRTPRPAEQRGALSYQTHREIDGHGWTDHVMAFDLVRDLYVSPTERVTEGTFEFSSRWQLVAPMLKADVIGGPRGLNVFYEPTSALFGPRGARLTAVAAGTTAAPDFRAARGRLAVVTHDGDGRSEREITDEAAAAGARAVLLVHYEDNAWTRWRPNGARTRVPLISVGRTDGTELLKRTERRRTTVAFTGTPRSPYLYDVVQVSSQGIPQHVRHTVSRRNTAVVHSVYADNGGLPWATEQRYSWRPYQEYAVDQFPRHVPTGFTRTEYVSAGDTRWQHLVLHETVEDIDWPLDVGMQEASRTYRAGERTGETWQGAVVRPSIPRGGAVPPTTRAGDVLRLRIPEFTDSRTGHWSRVITDPALPDGAGTTAATETVAAELVRDGEKVADLADAWQDVQVPSSAADYRLRLRTSRTSDEWRYATATDTAWSFRSGPTAEAAPLPLLQVDYRAPVDARNSVGPRRAYTLGLTVRHQDGLDAPRGVGARVEVSYDDGAHFTAAPTRSRGDGRFAVTVTKPPKVRGDAFVTLRVTARDGDGNEVRQTVTRAYLHRG
ncbi:S8 family serine peptidase [Streptomyces coelicoflavus]|uniref:S8 family serine peptidase n=1 Tax=Streptomyces coelicoflavus TaxID=285562 RepID=UPI0036566459